MRSKIKHKSVCNLFSSSASVNQISQLNALPFYHTISWSFQYQQFIWLTHEAADWSLSDCIYFIVLVTVDSEIQLSWVQTVQLNLSCECVSERRATRRELYFKRTTLARPQASFYSVTVQPVSWVDVWRLIQAYTHSYGSLVPVSLINLTIHCRADRSCQAAVGHSQDTAACRDAATYRWCCLCTKHPQQVVSLSPLGGAHLFFLYWQKYPMVFKHSRAAHARVDNLTF